MNIMTETLNKTEQVARDEGEDEDDDGDEKVISVPLTSVDTKQQQKQQQQQRQKQQQQQHSQIAIDDGQVNKLVEGSIKQAESDKQIKPDQEFEHGKALSQSLEEPILDHGDGSQDFGESNDDHCDVMKLHQLKAIVIMRIMLKPLLVLLNQLKTILIYYLKAMTIMIQIVRATI
ncbi:unnamed protein product [Ambrosiozyma monospora]|uniref:Unnamed protein product n=1 Tax=Ambrosiozyma monospora TaxID=43982 RepID=A0ACB5TBG3_AMBMO|nr:unnamed protein product [Ambrosiozyma monospora]